jgi:hypothetical protein
MNSFPPFKSSLKKPMEITLDSNGNPAIKFRHYDKIDSLTELAIKEFVKAAKRDGIKLANGNGYLNSSAGESWEDYFIVRGREPIDKEPLLFIYERMIEMYKENKHYDYMIKFKEIIDKL